MSTGLEIALAPERLDEGSAEERAAFGVFTIRANGVALTEGFDFFINGYRPGPLVSGYHAAEWFAWNWWRLRWEPRSASPDWWRGHKMTAIGEGYVWPNLTIFSDGVRTALISHPSSRPDAKPFRYLGISQAVVPSADFEAAVDAFVPQILGRLRAESVDETNLDRLWRDVLAERNEPSAARRRRLEALHGRDPDSIDDDLIERLVAEAANLGEAALDEVAADYARKGQADPAPPTAEHFRRVAKASGHDASPRDAVRLGPGFQPRRGATIPAWRVGAEAAHLLRDQEHLKTAPISDAELARLAGTSVQALSDSSSDGLGLSFALDATQSKSRIVLRRHSKTGRRFDLARLIGDRLLSGDGALHPATDAYTYRQKAQRTFAAELLSPFEAVEDMLAGDYSEDRQDEVAAHFHVSPWTINTLLLNHGRLKRETSEQDFDVAAA